MARIIESFKLKTVLDVDASKGRLQLQSTEKDVDKLGKRFTKLGPEIDKALKGKELGAKFGQQFSASATSLITGSMDSLGQTLGSLLGTAILPGFGTAIGSTFGSLADKLGGPIMSTVQAGIQLNKVLESTKVEFTSFTGSEKEAVKYLDDLLTLSKQTGVLPTNLIEASESLYDLTGNLKLTNLLLRASIDKAADIGGGPTKIREIADALGLIAEKGDLTALSLKKLFKLKINAPELLAEATGQSVDKIKKLMAEGRLRGDVAAQLIAEGLQRQSGGFAKKLASTTTQGAEDVFAAQKQILGAKGSENITQEYKKRLQQFNEIMAGPGAQQFVESINTAAGSALNLIDKGMTVGINAVVSVAKGIESGAPGVINAITNVGTGAIDMLSNLWGMKSPSRVFTEMGVGAVEGLENGLVDRTAQGFDRWADALEKAGGEAFIRGVAGIAKRLGVDPAWLLNVIAFESGFKAKAAHPSSSGRGLIQFMNPTARGLGFSSSDQITQLSAMEQLKLVEQYFNPFAGKMHSQGDVYSTVLAGRLPGPSGVLFRKGSKEYAANRGVDVNRDAVITADEIGKLASRKGGFSSKSKGDSPDDAVSRAIEVAARAGQMALTANGRPITNAAPMPVSVVQGAIGVSGAAAKFAEGTTEKDPVKATRLVTEAANEMAASLPPVSSAAALVSSTAEQVAARMPPLVAGVVDLGDAATATADTIDESQKKLNLTMLMAGETGVDMIGRLAGAIGQIGGMMPQQQVGRKRGFFSKLLGFAAPFLSFIPGVGPILSQIAGMASSAAAGNWAGVATGLAGGLQPGGVFRSSGVGSGPSSGGGGAAGLGAAGLGAAGLGGLGGGRRAAGGPGFRGRMYWTGEHGPEPFLAPDNGSFLSHRDAMRAMSNDGGSGDPAMVGMLERLHGVLARLEGVRPHDVVRMGARGLIQAYDDDAGLIRLSGQRHRLA